MRGRWAGGEAREQLWPQELEAKTEGKWLCSGRACSCGNLTGRIIMYHDKHESYG